MSLGDIPRVLALQRKCFPEPFPAELLWTEAHLNAHLNVFPEGQFVAELGSSIVGSASSALISEETWHAHLSWEATLGGFEFANHDPTGTTLYGADISVDPSQQGKGVGRALYIARFELVKALGLSRYGTACRMPGCSRWVRDHGGTPTDFAGAVVAGLVSDRTLTPLLRYGLNFLEILSDYMDDEESPNSGALLEWTPLGTSVPE